MSEFNSVNGKRKLLIATSNFGKFEEIKEDLAGISDLEVLGLADLGLVNDYVEDGSSHEEIALGKAKYFFDKCGIMTLADDTGIIVDALKNELGVKTRRWGAGESVSDQEWLDYFLKVMEPVSDEKRTARFTCCVCLIDENGHSNLFVGITEGTITRKMMTPIKKGIPLGTCFIPEGFDRVYTALSFEERSRVSHRAKAVGQVVEYLKDSNK